MTNGETEQEQKTSSVPTGTQAGAVLGAASGAAMIAMQDHHQQHPASTTSRAAAVKASGGFPPGTIGGVFNDVSKAIHYSIGERGNGEIGKFAGGPEAQAAFAHPPGTLAAPTPANVAAASGESNAWKGAKATGAGGTVDKMLVKAGAAVPVNARVVIHTALSKAPGVLPKAVAAAVVLSTTAAGMAIGGLAEGLSQPADNHNRSMEPAGGGRDL